MSSVISRIYISKLVPFALGSCIFSTIEKMDVLNRETMYPCFIILLSASQVDFTAGFQNVSQYQLAPWWRHDLDVFSAVVTFHEGTIQEIDNVISNADFWWLFVVRLNKLLNSPVAGDLRRNVNNLPSVQWPWPCWYTKSWRSGARRFRLRVRDIQTKWITSHLMTNPTDSFCTVTHRFIQYSPGPHLLTCGENC